jgi:hypothetical protein
MPVEKTKATSFSVAGLGFENVSTTLLAIDRVNGSTHGECASSLRRFQAQLQCAGVGAHMALEIEPPRWEASAGLVLDVPAAPRNT